MNQFTRTCMLLGETALKKIHNSKVAIFGMGGVGSHVAESLARVGIGTLILIDNDTVDITNINRQIIALHSTVGQDKVAVMKNRILDINPTAEVVIHKIFYSKNSGQGIIDSCDYVVDAIDSISSKLALADECNKKNILIISCMGTGNKLNPNLFEITDIFKTSVCPICRVMRQELKKCNIKSLKVVYSKEEPLKPKNNDFCTETTSNKRQTPGSMPFVPAVAGFIIASEVVKDICQNWNKNDQT